MKASGFSPRFVCCVTKEGLVMDLLLRCVERRRELEVDEPRFTVLALAGPEIVIRAAAAAEDEDEEAEEGRLLGSSSGMGTKTFGTDLRGAFT